MDKNNQKKQQPTIIIFQPYVNMLFKTKLKIKFYEIIATKIEKFQ